MKLVGLNPDLETILPEDGEGFNHRVVRFQFSQARRVNVVADAALKIKRPGRGRGPEGSSATSWSLQTT